ncbi:MAG: hypothetical protein E7561_01925 [Ruminococcaceae bacterium]|nr:hypothetical protein [Oscillospiraceae bacterium]
MKKLVLALIVIICICACGCQNPIKKIEGNSKIYGVWFSCFELDKMLATGDFKAEFSSLIEDCSELGITDMFVHTRPFCDSIYKSEYFPLRASLEGIDYDILEYMINACHQKGIRVHAWINPYRVKTDSTDINTLPTNSPARRWLEDDDPQNDTNVVLLDGIYLNPAAEDATRLVLDGIREIINNYDIDGIHFDDYFYPTESSDFDKLLYEKYSDKNLFPLPLSDWRRENVNAFVSEVSRVIKYQNSDVVFSISPAASLDKNYESLYADIALWTRNGYIDWIIPQLYFGFNYPETEFQFDNLYKQWQETAKNSDVKLIIGLASYKVDTIEPDECEEWSSGNLLKRQIEHINNSSDGCCFFSLSSLFGDTENQTNERENIRSLITRYKN